MNVYEMFMLESNCIEGEERLNPCDDDAIDLALTGIETENDILSLHKLLGEYLNKSWVGKYRHVNVTVGRCVPPKWENVPLLMQDYVQRLPDMDSFTAHNAFEKIHPFRDLNGRVGRLIWLSKAIDEGYTFSMPFLQKYYYQTLNYFEEL